MPSQKSRSKEDTWTTKELDSALNEDRERQRRERREKRERKEKSSTRDDKRNRRDKVISDDVERIRSRDSDDRTVRHSRDERQREAEREERRRKREGNEKKESSRHRNSDDRHKKDRDESERKRSDRHRNDEEQQRSDRHKSKNDRDDRRRHRDDDDRKNGDRHSRDDDKKRHDRNKDDDRKRSERHKDRDDDYKRKRHRNIEDEDDREKRRSERRKDREENGRDERERRKDRNEDEREKQRYERRELKESKSSSDSKLAEKEDDIDEERNSEGNGDDYNYDDDDFEDYEEDFEDVDDEEEDQSHNNMKPEDREMSDLLKALDEENARLAAGSGASYRSDNSEPYQDKYEAQKSQKSQVNRGRTFINFVSAKQRAVDQKVSNKTKKRGKDLLQLIEFDKASFDIFDLPPVKEYDLYIRSFGRTDTKQAYIQTNDDNLDRDIQTEEIELCDKWTQYPAEDLLGCGGDDVQSTSVKETLSSETDVTRMVKFVSKAAQAIGILLNEEETTCSDGGEKGMKSELSISNGFTHLGTPLILKDRHVIHAAYSPNEPNLLLTCYSMPGIASKYPSLSKGLLCVWNIMDPSNPQKYLACESHPTCCCFSPNRASLACAGMTDGSVVIWDLREQGFMHRLIKCEHEEYLFRFPTYNTAGISESENHHSPVKSLLPVFPDPTSKQYKDKESDSTSGLSFQLASMEENAIVNLWVVTEIPTSDSAGSEVDFGLSPGGKIKLVKSSTIKLKSPSMGDTPDSLLAFDLKLSSCDLNHFYVGTDTGFVIHGVRFGSSAFPRGHTSVIDTPLKVKTIDFSPFSYSYLLAGCSDGTVQLYHTKFESPIVSWSDLSGERSCEILCVRWSRSRPGVFFVLDDQSTLYTFDLLEGDSRPAHVDKISTGKPVFMVLNNDSKILGSGLTKYPQLFLALDNGLTELHNLHPNITEEKTLEGEFLLKFSERF